MFFKKPKFKFNSNCNVRTTYMYYYIIYNILQSAVCSDTCSTTYNVPGPGLVAVETLISETSSIKTR